MKKILFPLLLLNCFCFVAKSQTTLTAGDIAFTGYIGNGASSATDAFSFVLLKNITNSTTIKFTSTGWLRTDATTGSFRTEEETVTWTANSAVPAGAEIAITGLAASISNGGAATAGTVTGTALTLSANGDQVIAYQGASTSPTFISAIHMNVYNTANSDPVTTSTSIWDGNTNTANASGIPTGLTNGVNTIWIPGVAVIADEADNAKFTFSGDLSTAAAIRTAIYSVSNWTTSNDIPSFTLPTGYAFLAATSTTWNGTTWSNGSPSSTTDAIIASITAPASFTCEALTINSGVSLNTTGITATVNGNITNSGNGITGTGTLDITATSTLSGNAVTLSGTLNLSAGTFTTGGLLSIAPGGKITGTYANISGSVTLQQSIIGQRGWRIFSNPFVSAQTISTLASTNGISITTTPQASGLTDARTFSNATNLWTNVTGTTINANTAYSLFIRGLASEVTGASYTAGPTAFTYKTTGTLNGNSISITPTSTSNFILVGNPYAAPVKTSALTNGTGVSYYVYTIAQGGNQTLQRTKAGSWAAVLSSSTTTTIPVLGAIAYKPSSTSSYNITASTDINTSGTLQTGLFREQNIIPHLELQVEQDGTFQDKLFVRLDNAAINNGTDKTDLEKFWNDNTNLYTRTADNKFLGVDARSMMDSIPVGISALVGDYVFKVANYSLPTGYSTYLQDNFLNIKTELKENSTYPFSITNDAASKGEKRFVLNFSKEAPIDIAQAFAVKVLGNIIRGNTVTVSIAGSNEPVSITVTDMLGRKTSAVSNLTNGTSNINLGNVQAGIYLLQISNGKTVLVEKIVKQ